METYKRVFVIVLDSLGIGAMPDSEKFGDKGVDTFGHILDKMGTLDIPNLQKFPTEHLRCTYIKKSTEQIFLPLRIFRD